MTNNSDPDIEARLEDIERRLEEQDAVHAAEHVDLDAQLDDLEERQRALRHDLDGGV